MIGRVLPWWASSLNQMDPDDARGSDRAKMTCVNDKLLVQSSELGPDLPTKMPNGGRGRR